MRVNNLHEIAILIDGEFLREQISETFSIYEKIYPEKDFHELDLGRIIYNIALSGRVNASGNKVDVIFYYNSAHPILPLTNKPNNLNDFVAPEINLYHLSTNVGDFQLRSYFSDSTNGAFADNDMFMEQYMSGFSLLLSQLFHAPSVSQIVLFADNDKLSPTLNNHLKNTDKLVFIERRANGESNLRIAPECNGKFYWIDASYIIAMAMGLTANEL